MIRQRQEIAPAQQPRVAVIGAGPAGLMAAERAVAAGAAVTVFDAMPSAGRKFLLAGRGGLNLTHAESEARFRQRYGAGIALLAPALDAFDATAVRSWADALGAATFVGSSGRVFPRALKASPLLRAWLQRLADAGVHFAFRHRLIGIDPPAGDSIDAAFAAPASATDGARLRISDEVQLRFATPDGELRVAAAAVVLALGGASWPRLGTDGAWASWLGASGVEIAPFEAANCGFAVPWSAHLRARGAGAALKNVCVRVLPLERDVAELSDPDAAGVRGEFVLTDYGVEGGLIYALSMQVRARQAVSGSATVLVDLVPDLAHARVHAALAAARAGRSLASVLTRALGLDATKRLLLFECVSEATRNDAAALARAVKALPLVLGSPRPIAEAISTAGGVRAAALVDACMLRVHPGVFVAGEMLDWDAPTGGYLLTAVLATGARAGAAAARHVQAGAAADRSSTRNGPA